MSAQDRCPVCSNKLILVTGSSDFNGLKCENCEYTITKEQMDKNNLTGTTFSKNACPNDLKMLGRDKADERRELDKAIEAVETHAKDGIISDIKKLAPAEGDIVVIRTKRYSMGLVQAINATLRGVKKIDTSKNLIITCQADEDIEILDEKRMMDLGWVRVDKVREISKQAAKDLTSGRIHLPNDKEIHALSKKHTGIS